jgi:hypothetical protein
VPDERGVGREEERFGDERPERRDGESTDLAIERAEQRDDYTRELWRKSATAFGT